MREIKDVFDAKASSVQAVFHTEMGVAGFSIPIYQRQYSWDEENINRLLEDIREGLILLGSVNDYLTFIGTILLVDDKQDSEPTFDGKSLSVVDGQQRLTTLSLISCVLHTELSAQLIKQDNWPDDMLTTSITEEARYLTDILFSCSIGRPSGPTITDIYKYFPRIVRQDLDIRADTASEAKYHSPIAEFLFQFCDNTINTQNNNFIFEPNSPNDDTKSFELRLKIISNYVTAIGGQKSDIEFPSIIDLLQKPQYRKILFPKLQQRSNRIQEVLGIIRTNSEHPTKQLIRLIAYANFLLNRVAITQVIADEERYAFDIFEALNTTGEPLTALETFKPVVIQFENKFTTKYMDSPSHNSFIFIEEYIRHFVNYEAQQKESREIIVLHALYVSGKKVGLQLNSQRKFLRNNFNESKGDEAKRRFVSALADIAKFRNKFWNKDNLSYQLRSHPEKEIAFFCLSFLRDLKSTLTIPLLVRYWMESINSNDNDIFIKAIKAITAFIVLRRAATGGTQGIDDDYRKIMSEGGRTKEDGIEKLKLGLGENVNQAPQIEILMKYLRSYLKNPKLRIQTKEDWLQRVSQQPLYKGPVPLCRFILLCAAHNSIPDTDHPYLLKKGRPKAGLQLLNLDSWKDPNFETREHIAPQSNNGSWDHNLYNDINLIHLLGNLTLLPGKENSAIGDKPWEKKRIFFQAAAATTNEEVELNIDKAKKQGFDFGDKVNKMLKEGSCLPVVSTVAGTPNWNEHIIKERTRNIAELVWQELSEWIGEY